MSENGTSHPLKVGTRVVYDPPSVHLDNREGTIDSLDDDDWGILYVVEDSEEEFPISIGESSIVRTLESETCRCEGVGARTRVVCSHDGEAYGPHPEASFDIQCCPYCGGNATGGDHRIDPGVGEVFCEETGQSTWRYCPNCGDKLGGDA